MPKFSLDHPTQKSVDETFQVVKKILSNGTELQKFDPKAKIQFNDESKSCQINGGQFKADMNVTTDGPGSKVTVHVDIPFLLSPFKGKIQETLQKMLAKHLA